VVLIGPSGSGKSHWAAQNFRPEQIVSSDNLRAAVGVSEHDQAAGTDAFEVLDMIVRHRLSRKLLTVIDTLGLDVERRAKYRELANRSGLACHAVLFDTSAEVCKSRNRARVRPVPARVLTSQLAALEEARTLIPAEGFDGVHSGQEPAEVVPAEMIAATGERDAITNRPQMRFGLQLSSFPAGAHPSAFAERLAEVASVAEGAGFTSIWLMDHMVQIPQVGRVWEDLPESWTTLSWIAARTTKVRVGTLVTGVTLRNPAHLAKIVATVDVLSGGRALCGVGLGWWDWEHRLYGWEFPGVADRYALLEDTLRLLRLMWGPGSPAFNGDVLSVPEAICYPRPLQEHVPILIGGSGERRTLRVAALHADACNLFGDPSAVERKVSILNRHCEEVGRPRDEVRVTHLSTAVVAGSRREVDADVDRLRSGQATREQAAQRFGAGTVEDQVERYEQLAGAGVQTAIVSLPDAFTPGALEAFGSVIASFDAPPPRTPW
jgi:F420-dependent oxidoreductase-like protein